MKLLIPAIIHLALAVTIATALATPRRARDVDMADVLHKLKEGKDGVGVGGGYGGIYTPAEPTAHDTKQRLPESSPSSTREIVSKKVGALGWLQAYCSRNPLWPFGNVLGCVGPYVDFDGATEAAEQQQQQQQQPDSGYMGLAIPSGEYTTGSQTPAPPTELREDEEDQEGARQAQEQGGSAGSEAGASEPIHSRPEDVAVEQGPGPVAVPAETAENGVESKDGGMSASPEDEGLPTERISARADMGEKGAVTVTITTTATKVLETREPGSEYAYIATTGR
ncbi:hypothetical protein NKR23_g1367 [Pleurostoma richardsiae]|uniref:Uncharacterized protein n=1 Tax=Pleurostoma richardsiae TaxID=41990 RepID=A0AA38S5A3_9PEZI|nr:hypothetical protein NKR23_g1367 [Pleurostoma richardsiae]